MLYSTLFFMTTGNLKNIHGSRIKGNFTTLEMSMYTRLLKIRELDTDKINTYKESRAHFKGHIRNTPADSPRGNIKRFQSNKIFS